MPIEKVSIKTQDGDCPSYVIYPSGTGPWPAVIFYGDAGGIRPAMVDMATMLANAGYVVLLHDVYYRYGPYGPLVPKQVFKGDVAAILGPLMATTGNDKTSKDTAAFLDYLDTRRDVAGLKFGAIGFCMGGAQALAAAATYSERFAAVASFHGGNLATDAPTSPHLLLPNLKAQAYIASADNDESYPAAMAVLFEESLAKAGVRYRAETYLRAGHGWMVPDFPVYDPSAADRGWTALLELFDLTLHG